MNLPRTMNARRLRIAELLQLHPVRSQGDLIELLQSEGIEVTQATVSRDLDELRAGKIPGPNGELIYAVPGEGPDDSLIGPDAVATGGERLARVGEEILISADASGNIVVLRTPPGAAQYLASVIDHTVLPEVIGTVAGDDTVLLVTRDADGGPAVADRILELINQRVRP